MSTRAADDFEAIRKAYRANAEAEGRCKCPKTEGGTRTGAVNPDCPAHGKWLGEREAS